MVVILSVKVIVFLVQYAIFNWQWTALSGEQENSHAAWRNNPGRGVWRLLLEF